MSLLNRENKIKTITIFEGHVDISHVDPTLREMVQNILNEFPPQRIFSRYINYHGEILELQWNFDKYQQVSWMDIENGQGTIRTKVHTGITCSIQYMGYNRGKILFDDKLLENSMIYDCVLKLKRNLYMTYNY